MILPAGAQGPAFLLSEFSDHHDLQPLGVLCADGRSPADRFMGGEAIARMPENEQAMSLADVKQLQGLLNSRGFASGDRMAESDAKPGCDQGVSKNTRSAEDGYASRILLESLKN